MFAELLSTLMVAIMAMCIALKLSSQLPTFDHILGYDNGSERVVGRSNSSETILFLSCEDGTKHEACWTKLQSKVNILHYFAPFTAWP